MSCKDGPCVCEIEPGTCVEDEVADLADFDVYSMEDAEVEGLRERLGGPGNRREPEHAEPMYRDDNGDWRPL